MIYNSYYSPPLSMLINLSLPIFIILSPSSSQSIHLISINLHYLLSLHSLSSFSPTLFFLLYFIFSSFFLTFFSLLFIISFLFFVFLSSFAFSQSLRSQLSFCLFIVFLFLSLFFIVSSFLSVAKWDQETNLSEAKRP